MSVVVANPSASDDYFHFFGLNQQFKIDLPALETNTAMPAAFLMKQMEWRENLDEQAEDLPALEALMAEVEQSKQDTLAEIAQAIDGAKNYLRAAELLRGLLFIDKFAVELDDTIAALI